MTDDEKNREDEAIIQRVADDLPVGVWVARAPGGEFVYANEKFREIMGTGPRDDVAVGEYAQPYGICTREGDPYPEEKMPFVRALNARKTVIVDDIVIHRPDGRRVYIRAQAKPVRDESDRITHVVIAFIDITPEVEAQQARAESEKRFQRARRMETIGQLAGGIAHDFNNLLSVIKTLASTHLETEAGANLEEDLKTIDDVTDRAVELTRALLGVAGKGKNRAEPLSLRRVVNSLRPILNRTLDARIDVQLDLRGTNRFLGDVTNIEQVVLNLVLNAQDAILPDKGLLHVRTRDEKEWCVLEVEDTGPGIPEEVRDRIFEPYFTTKGKQGSGLGLATVYGIVESHDGTVEVVEDWDGGTCMRVRFPALAAPTRPDAPQEEELRPRPGSGCILVVDDLAWVRSTSQRALEQLGYRVLAAGDGLEALEVFRESADQVDGVLLDMKMPRMDGRETYFALRKLDPDVPVLLTTGHSLNEEVQELLDHGAQGFLEKPFGIRLLSEAIDQILTVG